MGSSKKKSDGLKSKVWNFEPCKDEYGKYIPYCDFNHHCGIVLDEDVCEARQCSNYMKLYFCNGVRFEDK